MHLRIHQAIVCCMLGIVPIISFLTLYGIAACAERTPSSPDPIPSDTSAVIPPGEDSVFHPERRLALLHDERLLEISGIAASRRDDGLLWLHNDSGDKPRIFAIDTLGNLVAEIALLQATHRDYEDMASATIDGIHWLYIGDVGDNSKRRDRVTVYRFVEPAIASSLRDTAFSITVEHMHMRYPDGPRDCEALFVDPRDGYIYLIEKTGLVSCGVYRTAWQTGDTDAVLERVFDVRIPQSLGPLRLVTGADFASTADRIVVRTYGAMYEYSLPGATSPLDVLNTEPSTTLTKPVLQQAEAVCYTRDGRHIYTTSEGENQPLYRIERRDGQ